MADDGAKGGGSSGVIAKVFATVFGAVVCPILVAVGVKYLAPKDDAKPTPVVEVVKAADKDKVDPSDKDKVAKDKDKVEPSDKAKVAKDKDKVEPSDKDKVAKDKEKPAPDTGTHLVAADLGRSWWIYERVFEKGVEIKAGKDVTVKGGDKGKDFSGPSQWIRLKDKDTAAALQVARFEDGVLHVPGDKQGALVSKNTYDNYHLIVEYKWQFGAPASGGVKKKPRQCGIILHAHDDVKQPWMSGIVCLLRPADAGAIQLRGDPGKVTAKATAVEKLEEGKKNLRRDYKPGAPVITLVSGTKGAGIVHRLGNSLNTTEDEDPTLAKDDLEKDYDWNKLECICERDAISVRLNGKDVNACTSVNRQNGFLVLLAEGSNMFFRKIDVLPLKK